MDAVKPDFYSQFPSLTQDLKEGKKESTPEELALYAMSQGKGWKVFKGIVDEVSKDLNNLNKDAVASGASLEEIGRNTVIVTLVQGVIERVMNRVDDAIEACEQNVPGE